MSTAPQEKPRPSRTKVKTNRYPRYAPRFWHGMTMRSFFRLLWNHRFRVNPWRLSIAVLMPIFATFNSVMNRVQALRYGRRLRDFQWDQEPVFIIGHWRSGTTHLHELMSLDERFTTPTTFQCFAPKHFLVTERWMPRVLWFLLPSKRPMDNMAMGWNRPQEDEFALLSMGLPTPYLRMAFPNDGPVDMNYLNMQGIAPDALEHWKQTLDQFCNSLVYHRRKQLLLKSPTHTGRLALLAKMYPKAKFIHITRHPYAVYASSVRLWKSLDSVQGFQLTRNDAVEEYVDQAFEAMYGTFEQQRAEIPPEQIIDIKYEDVVADPRKEIQRIYQELDLGDFAPLAEPLDAYLEKTSGYQVNRHEIDEQAKAHICQQWQTYMQQYEYEE